MATPHNIHLCIDNLVLKSLIAEQLQTIKHYTQDDGKKPDCILLQTVQAIPIPENCAVLDIPKGAVRLGELMDKMGYLLSGRELHIEDDSQTIALGAFHLIPADNILIHVATKSSIYLTDKERLLLRLLFESGNQGLHKRDLLKAIWRYADDAETHTLETHVYRLRQKLEPYNQPQFIQVQDGVYFLKF